jgi:hypothetical protein
VAWVGVFEEQLVGTKNGKLEFKVFGLSKGVGQF